MGCARLWVISSLLHERSYMPALSTRQAYGWTLGVGRASQERETLAGVNPIQVFAAKQEIWQEERTNSLNCWYSVYGGKAKRSGASANIERIGPHLWASQSDFIRVRTGGGMAP